jgi:para-aminobenzoate synthetase component 1
MSIPYSPEIVGGYYSAISEMPWSVWLDSGGMSRYDILTAAPQHKIVIQNGEQQAAFTRLRQALGEKLEANPEFPFSGGALGYWGYDLKSKEGKLENNSQEREPLPLMAIGIYDWALVVDHQMCTAQLVSHLRYEETSSLLKEVLQRLSSRILSKEKKFRVIGKVSSNFSRSEYGVAFNRIQEYLRAGDCYQVNLAQCFKAQAGGNALNAYFKLRHTSPAPYSAFLNLPHAQILCASPERFLQVRGRQVETKPIKGTRPRSADEILDRRLAEELQNHPKDRAENLMIVDLLRNDLGKSCKPGSIIAPEMFSIESYANVHHLVSTVKGELLPERDAIDVLSDCFPGGSITGAPKQRAIEIIDELEPDRREVYCGSIGYLGFDGNMDINITIRTMVFAKNEIRFWVGGGIVADSNEDDEYQETLDKASGMLEVLKSCGGQ